jgi:hypothetical protein
MKIIKFTSVIFTLLLIIPIKAQNVVDINPNLLAKSWSAKWITHPNISGTEYGVYHFRKSININHKVNSVIMHVSADNRYKLFVNGKYVTYGPSRGDFLNWNFESIDIAPYLSTGKNTIAAEVWNYAEYRPIAQFSYKTGFIIQGNNQSESIINSNKSWKVLKNEAYSAIPIKLRGYYVAGPGDNVIGENYPWGWEKVDYDDSNWINVKEGNEGKPRAGNGRWRSSNPISLSPRKIPLMEEKLQRFKEVRSSNISFDKKSFVKGKNPITIPANSKVKILLDQSVLTNAFPVLICSKGKGSIIKASYAESLYLNDKDKSKGNRNKVENKIFVGKYDTFTMDGGIERKYQPLWWHCFRYAQLEIETAEEPLTINDFYSIFTAYPLKEKAYFKSDDNTLDDIWTVGWRTQRLCAGELFFDCPYYEQLQYVGDARIQALVTAYVSGDLRLMRKVISSTNDSYLSLGLTQSRYPSYEPQLIPPFSLVWITMVHDFWMLEKDDAYIREKIPTIMNVMNWFQSKLDNTHLLGPMEWWSFVDWNWNNGVPPGATDGNSAVISLQYVYTLQKAADLLKAFGMKEEANRYIELANKIGKAIYAQCFDSTIGLIADTPNKDAFSQHASTLAVLANVVPESNQATIMSNILSNKSIDQCTFYFKFYLIEAVKKVGLGDKFTELLKPWHEMLSNGLTTFAEKPDPTRSDCHAWSASPVYYFLSLVCGIQPETPGFNSVRVEPHFGSLKSIEGAMPHKLGEIKVSLKQTRNNGVAGVISLPEGLKGTFIWNNASMSLKGGENKIKI